jgi:hypothetical protein
MAGCAAGAVRAAPAPREIAFSIPAGTLSANLVKFAVQANISLGLGSVGGCAKASQGLAGQYTVGDGLQRLLAGSGCSYRSLDAGAYEIQPLPPTSSDTDSASASDPSASPAVTADDGQASVEVAELLVVASRSTLPDAASSWAQAESPLTALSNALDNILHGLFGSRSANTCGGCSRTGEFQTFGPNPVPAPRPGPNPAIAVAEPGAWATILVGLGGIGVTLRSARRNQTKVAA